MLFPQKVKVSTYRSTAPIRTRTSAVRRSGWPARQTCCIGDSTNVCSAAAPNGKAVASVPGLRPLLLQEGWLEIYHGSRRVTRAGEVGTYSAGALLLDRDNPARILRRSHEPIMQPTADFERSGFVANVVFPTALVDRGDTLQRVLRGRRHIYRNSRILT